MTSLRQNKEIEAYNDVFYTPTYIDYLIDCLKELIKKDFKGIIHITGSERVSRYQFALKMAEVLNKNPSLIKPVKQPKKGLIAKDSSLNSKMVRKILKNFCPKIIKSLHYGFGNLVSPYFYFIDERGRFIGINQSGKWEEINFVESLKSCVRGNHYHKKTREGFYIVKGKIKVKLIDLADNSEKDFIVESGDIFTVGPNILHTFEILEDSKWINFLSKKMGDTVRDIHRI